MSNDGAPVDVPESDVMDALGGMDGAGDTEPMPDGEATDAPLTPSESEGQQKDMFGQAFDLATRAPSKSLAEIDEGEYFDPENGGTRRLMLVFDDIVSDGEGLQNWMHVCVAMAEIAVDGGIDALDGNSKSGESTESNPETTLEQTDTNGVDIA